MRFESFLLCFPLIAACGDRASSGGGVTLRDSAGITIVESSAPPPNAAASLQVETTASLTLGVEEGDEALQLHRVSDAMRLPDGRIVIANSGTHELRLFDAGGKYLRSVGRRGGGPGEFGDFSFPRLFRHGDKIYATDDNGFRVHAYNLEIGFRETRRFQMPMELPRPFPRGVLADGSWLSMAYRGGGALRGPPGSVITLSFTLLVFDSTGAFARTFGSFEGRKRYVNQVGDNTHYPYLPLTADPVIRARSGEGVVLRGANAELELWSADGSLTRIIRWPRERTRSADVYPRIRGAELERIAQADERTRVMYGAFYRKELPLPEFVPLYQNAIVDEAQRIWVERYRTIIDDPTPRWDVIDTTGQWVGTVATPRGVTVYQIGGDFLLGLQRDSLGVERVVLHRVHGG